MQIVLLIKHTGWSAEVGFSRRGFQRLLKDAYTAIGQQWVRECLPKHFTKAGAAEYDYAPRKGEGSTGKAFWRSYTGRKQKRFGHSLPLVFSGELQANVLAGPNITATSRGCRVRLGGSNKANWKHPASQVDMRAELTRISAAERKKLTLAMNAQIDRAIRRYSGSRQRRSAA